MPNDRQFVRRLLGSLTLFFAAMAVALRPMQPGHSFDLNVWVQMCVFLSATSWLLGHAERARFRVARTGVGVPLLVLLAVALVSTLRSPHKAASIAALLDWTACAALFAILASLTAESVDRRLVLRVLWASAFVVVLYGLFQQFVNLPLTLQQIEGSRERVLLELGMSPKEYDNLVQRARGRIYSTFLVANSFAGFLCLVVPGFVGHLLDRLRAGDRRKGFLALSALWLAGALACLLLTYSRGGWLVFGVSAVLFCLMLGAPTLRRHKRIVAATVLGAVLAVALLFATGIVPLRVFRDGVASFAVRVDYWRGAWDMAMDNPVAGVGLGTFGDHYPRYRFITARMVRAAHNDYLQVLAELGVVGLAAFLWTWGACLRSSARPRPEPAEPACPEGLGLGAGLAAFVLTMVTATLFVLAGWGDEPGHAGGTALLALGLAGAWALAFVLLRSRGTERSDLCRKGLFCGLVAFLLHCAVDFDYAEPGVLMSAWVVAALAVAPRKDFLERRLGPAAALALGVGAVAAMCGFQFALLRVTQASAERGAAQATAAEALRSPLPATRSRLLGEAQRHFERALAYGPFDAESRLAYADLVVHLAPPSRMTEGELDEAVALYRRAAALNPPSPAAHLRLAGLFERLAVSGRRDLLKPYVDAYLASEPAAPRHPVHLPAVREYAATVERDPNRPLFRARLAVALGRLGSPEASRAEARRALDLHEQMLAKHPEHVMRLPEDDLEQVRALLAAPPEGRP